MATFEIPDYNVPKKEKPADVFVGTLKQRLTLDVTVDMTCAYSNDWGSGLVVKMRTAAGEIVTAFGMHGVSEGQSIRIKGTVKAHNEYKGQKETVLNRVVVL